MSYSAEMGCGVPPNFEIRAAESAKIEYAIKKIQVFMSLFECSDFMQAGISISVIISSAKDDDAPLIMVA
ncbi:hypothetical protein D3C75_1120110 [compost metagenome]